MFPLRRLMFLAWAFFTALPFHAASAEETVTICGESWPPYLYEAGGESGKQKSVAGIHLQNFGFLSELTGLEFKLRVLP